MGKFNDIPCYHSWFSMKQRCFNKNNKDYNSYGGRGITVCDEWKSLKGFQKWALKNGWKQGLTIDRINVNGNYEPSNCRWATVAQQNRNMRRNNNIDIDEASEICEAYASGKFTQKELGQQVGVHQMTISRLVNEKWHIVDEKLFVN